MSIAKEFEFQLPTHEQYVQRTDGLRVHHEWEDWIKEHLGGTVEALFTPRTGEPLDKPGLASHRRRWRIKIGGRTVYLKTYTATDAAQVEWDAIFQLASAGIPTMLPVAFGRAASGASLLMTEQIPGGVSLEAWTRQLLANGRPPSGKAKARLIEAMAELAAQLHLAGFVHRDLYLSHIFVRGEGPPWRLHLIDLARIFRPSPLRIGRWITKDLAALLYSMPKSVFDESDQAKLLRHYGEQYEWKVKGRLPSVAAVWEKVAKIRHHDGRRRMGRWPVMLPAPADASGPLRVAIFIERFDPTLGGAEKSTRQFAKRLVACGHHVTVFTTQPGPPISGVEVVCWPGSRRALWRRRRFRQRCAEVAAAGEFHIYHSLGYTESHNVLQPRAGVSAVQREAKHPGGRKWPNFRAKRIDAAEKRAVELTPRPFVTPISRFTAEQIHSYFDLPTERLVSIFNGIDPSVLELANRRARRAAMRAELLSDDGEVLLLSVAHDFRLKGIPEMIRAAALLNGESFRHVVVGRGKAAPYRKLAASLGIEDRVRFVGATDDVRPFYAAADVLVHPTRYDTGSRVVLEALALGLPVITTHQNGAAEIITDGKEGWVIPSADGIEALAEAMRKTLAPAWRKAAGEAALALRSKLDIKRHIDEAIALYRRVIEEGPGE